MPLPMESPDVLHPALKQLSALTDLVAYQAWISRKTKIGDRPGKDDWIYTRQFADQYCDCTADQMIGLLQDSGAENEVIAMFIVANSIHLLP